MLLEFIRDNRSDLIMRARDKVRSRASPPATPAEIESGVPQFLTQFAALLAETNPDMPATPALGASATRRGGEMLRHGFTIGQVVHDYGDICQAVTELAGKKGVELSTDEFHTLNLCLDNAIANAVTEYSRQREHDIAKIADDKVASLSILSHELRNLISTATMAFEVLRGGTVAIGGNTGNVLERSLTGLRDLVARSLAEAPA